MVKMRLSVRLCAAVAAVVGVVVAAEHVEQREVHNRRGTASPLVPAQSLTYELNRRIFYEHGRQGDDRTIDPQGRPIGTGVYWASRRNRGRHQPPGSRAGTQHLHTEAMTADRHGSRTQQPMRTNTTGLPVVRDPVNDPLPVSRTSNPGDERFSSRMHQARIYTSLNDRRRLPHARGSYETRVSPTLRDRFQRPPPETSAEVHNRVSYDNAWAAHTPSAARRPDQVSSGVLEASSRPVVRPTPPQHRVPDTRSSLDTTSDPFTAATITGGIPTEPDAARERLRTQHSFSEIGDELNNDVLQRLDQLDPCCGSRVSYDPLAARPIGPFERVASAGSIKVVEVPTHNSYPPGEVRDLQVAPRDRHTLYLTWTAPGEDLDSGTVSGYIIRLSEALRDLQESQFDAAPENTLIDASETLTAAGVYQEAGTRVDVEVPLAQHLQRGRVYYVALKAMDSDGNISGVSNMARFLIPESSTDDSTAASHSSATTSHLGADPRIEEFPGRSRTRGSLHRNEERTIITERNFRPPATRGSYTENEAVVEPRIGANNQQQSLLSTSPTPISDPSEPEGSENQRKPGGRKDRKRKKNKKSKKKRRKSGRNWRRESRRRENNDTSVWNSHALDIYAELDRWNES